MLDPASLEQHIAAAPWSWPWICFYKVDASILDFVDTHQGVCEPLAQCMRNFVHICSQASLEKEPVVLTRSQKGLQRPEKGEEPQL